MEIKLAELKAAAENAYCCLYKSSDIKDFIEYERAKAALYHIWEATKGGAP